jgi:hypothetical protein
MRAKQCSASVFLATAVLLAITSTVTMAQTPVTVRPLDSSATAVTLYTVSFALPDSLHPDAEIAVTFPNGFDLKRVEIAGSSTITGGLDVSVDSQTVVIRRKGRGGTYAPGTQVDVKFATVVNPQQARDDYEVEVLIRRGGSVVASGLRGRFAIIAKP